jgi:hypothetical protein
MSEYIKTQTANSVYKYRGKNSIKEGSLKSFVHIDHLIISFPSAPSSFYRDDKPQSAHTTNTSLLCRHYNEPCFHPHIHPLTDQSETVAETRDREYRREKNKTEI